MLAVSPLIGTYWRRPPPPEHAFLGNALRLLKQLQRESGLATWYPSPVRARWQHEPIALQPLALAALVQREGTLGARRWLRLWNGNPHAPAAVAIDCRPPTCGQPSSVHIHLPPEFIPGPQTFPRYERLLHSAIDAWDPDFGVVTTLPALVKSPPLKPGSVKGWFVYRRGDTVRRADFHLR